MGNVQYKMQKKNENNKMININKTKVSGCARGGLDLH